MSDTLLSRKTVTARKSHPCWVCGMEAIAAGQTYERETYAGDGRAYTIVSCSDCAALFAEVWEYAGGIWNEGISPDDYAIWADEHRSDDRALALLMRMGMAS